MHVNGEKVSLLGHVRPFPSPAVHAGRAALNGLGAIGFTVTGFWLAQDDRKYLLPFLIGAGYCLANAIWDTVNFFRGRAVKQIRAPIDEPMSTAQKQTYEIALSELAQKLQLIGNEESRQHSLQWTILKFEDSNASQAWQTICGQVERIRKLPIAGQSAVDIIDILSTVLHGLKQIKLPQASNTTVNSILNPRDLGSLNGIWKELDVELMNVLSARVAMQQRLGQFTELLTKTADQLQKENDQLSQEIAQTSSPLPQSFTYPLDKAWHQMTVEVERLQKNRNATAIQKIDEIKNTLEKLLRIVGFEIAIIDKDRCLPELKGEIVELKTKWDELDVTLQKVRQALKMFELNLNQSPIRTPRSVPSSAESSPITKMRDDLSNLKKLNTSFSSDTDE